MKIELQDINILNADLFLPEENEYFVNENLNKEYLVRDGIYEILTNGGGEFRKIVGYSMDINNLPQLYNIKEDYIGAIMLEGHHMGIVWNYFTEQTFKEIQSFIDCDIDELTF